MGGGTRIESSGDGARLRFDPSFWITSAGATLAALLPAWVDRGWLAEPPETEYPDSIVLAGRLWDQLGSGVGLEDAPAEMKLFSNLFEVQAAHYEVTSESFLSGADFRLSVLREGVPLPFGGDPFIGEPSSRTWLPPCVVAVRRWIAEATDHADDGARLTLVHRLQALVRYARSTGIDLVLDEHLASFEILTPERIKLGWETSPRTPKLFDLRMTAELPDGRSEPLLPEHLDATSPVARLGSRRYLVLGEEAAASARHVARKQQSRSSREVALVIQDPAAALPAGVASDLIDLSEYSTRVAGFERVVRAARPQDIRSSGVRWFVDEAAGSDHFLSLDIASPDPAQPAQTLSFATPVDAERARDKLRTELQRPTPAIVAIADKEVYPTEALFHRLDVELAIHRRDQPRLDEEAEPFRSPPRLAAIIREDATIDADDLVRLEGAVPWANLDAALAPAFKLKPHQRGGIAWLWYHFTRHRPGVLLADDMGLGKTLQVASFLALQQAAAEKARPSLIVAPVILLENWLAELDKFFRPGTFARVLILQGDGLSRMRRGSGLDLEALAAYDLVITNYETLARFQLDLLRVDWATVVLDEGHAIKNPATLRARAASGLKRQFAICMTGTPVENRLADLWSLYFFLSPQRPFGTRGQFIAEYEDGTDGPARMRAALALSTAESSLLRRTKKEVASLPPKDIQTHLVPMSDEQRELERRIVSTIQAKGGGAFEILSQLQKLYQHPWLLRPEVFGSAGRMPSVEAACAASPKLSACVRLLEGVRERGEKALVFTRWVQMQTLLAYVLRTHFGLPRVLVINGETNQKRQALSHIREFESGAGFNVLVLSPLAAGVGLNIVAANHVVHYDRWWNPAKEDQATDRAYRIGQERPVSVHYPILHHPGDPHGGFDVKLHDLVSAKRQLATDFLAPSDAQEITAEQLLSMFGTGAAQA